MYKPEPFLVDDLTQLGALQPPGWSNLLPSFHLHLQIPFIYPFKVVHDTNLVAVGAAIIHHDVAWLAHIITHPEYRRQGLGQCMTQFMVDLAFSRQCSTVQLVATELGAPVYEKIGFITSGSYEFYERTPARTDAFSHHNIRDYHPRYRSAIFRLDKLISGEDRSNHLQLWLAGAKIYLNKGKLQGFYLPRFGDGVILAENEDAGRALMQYRLNSWHQAVLPTANAPGNDFLKSQNFVHCRSAKRMYLGKPLRWQPEGLYNRISGQIG